MPGPDGAALRREVRRDVRQAGLPPDGPEAALLDLLRAVPETHIDATAAQRLAAEAGFALARSEVAAMLEALARAGLLGRLPVTGGPPVYDTEARAHAHIVDEATATRGSRCLGRDPGRHPPPGDGRPARPGGGDAAHPGAPAGGA
jgi:hypothetical protein